VREIGEDLIRCGFAIMPCKGKIPVTSSKHGYKGGFKDATRDMGYMLDMLDVYPDADSWGVVPAKCDPPMVVLDIDVKDGACGRESYAALADEGLLPETLEVTTPTGGFHLYYTLPYGAEAPGNHPLAKAIDVRSANGYVIWYGGRQEARPPMAEAPLALVQRCGQREDRDERSKEWLVEEDRPEAIKAAMSWLIDAAKHNPPQAKHGANELTYRTATKLRDFGIGKERAIGMLWDNWNSQALAANGEPRPKQQPYHMDQLEGIVENAYNYALRPGGIAQAEADEGMAMMREAIGYEEQAEEEDKPLDILYLPDEIDHMSRPKYLIKGVYYEQTIGFMVGPTRSFKSFIALDQACHIASGMDWAGQRTKQRDVMFVASEGAAGIKSRMKAWRNAYPEADISRLRTLMSAPQLHKDGLDRIAKNVAWYHRKTGWKPDLIFIDTFATSTSGVSDTDAEAMGLIIHNMRALTEALQTAIIVVHHTGKDASRGARGWSGLEAAADTVTYVTANTAQELVTLDFFKSKEARPLKPITLKATDVEDGGLDEDDGSPLTSLVFAISKEPPVTSKATKMPQRGTHERRDLFRTVAGQVMNGSPVTAPALATNIAEVLVSDDAEEGDTKVLATEIRKWLSKIATGAIDDPVMTKYIQPCAVEGASRMWARPQPDEPVS